MQLINLIYNDLLLNKIRTFVIQQSIIQQSPIHPSVHQSIDQPIYMFHHLVTSKNLTSKITWSLGKSSPHWDVHGT